MKNGNWRENISPSLRSEYRRSFYQSIRLRAMALLGDKCIECGFSDIRALQIDHVNSDGKEDRKKTGSSYYYHIIKEIEKGNAHKYQILCANHNKIKCIEKQEYPLNPNALTA